MENLDTRISNARKMLVKDHEENIVKQYTPFFKEIGDKAVSSMEEQGVDKIQLSPKGAQTQTLIFNKKGAFKLVEVDYTANVSELPKIYQDHSDYIAGCADSRGHRTPSYLEAMGNALDDFRSKVKGLITRDI